MFDIGWTEMVAIAIVAILVIGPRELPKALRTAGKFIAKARSMARDFQSGFDDLVREAELEEVKSKIDKSVDPSGTLDGLFDDEKPDKVGDTDKRIASNTGNTGDTPAAEEDKPELIDAAEVMTEPDAPSSDTAPSSTSGRSSASGRAPERAGS